MNLKELKEIIQQIVETDISEFEFERSGVRIRIRRGSKEQPTVSLAAAIPAPSPVVHPAAGTGAAGAVGQATALQESAPPAEELHAIRSPIVGTFYRAPSPGAEPFVTIGDHVEVGQVLCIIEAMKLMNEIESDTAGEIVRIQVENAQPVEYGEALFMIRPR